VTRVPLAALDASPCNTRKDQDAGAEDASLDDLARNLDAVGLINPILVRPGGAGRYEVVAGGRRVAAARRLGWTAIPAFVRGDLDDAQALVVSLTENVHRADMHPLDKARAFEALLRTEGGVAGVARRTGVSEATVRRYLALRRLSPELQARVTTHGGPAGVGAMAELAARFDDPTAMGAAWDRVRGLTGGAAQEALRRSGGDLGALDREITRVIQEEFGRPVCGTSLETCPFLPPGAGPAVRAALAGLAGGTASEHGDGR
jgi:ParB family chromosome partitioning protein